MDETRKNEILITNEEKNLRLNEVIYNLSSYGIEYSEIIEELKDIYDGEYRHSYAQISRTIFCLDFDERDIVSSELETIISKLVELEQSNPSSYSSVRKSVLKLKDHIDLEIMRYNLNDEANEKFENALVESDELARTTSDLFDEVSELQNKSWDLQNKMDSSNTQSITILSIFAGIVFVFTGGFSLISTALQNINNASIYKLTFVLSLVGILIFNLIFLFFYMIAKLTEKNISSSCLKTSNSYCYSEEQCGKCKPLLRFFRRFYYIMIPNVCFVLVMTFSVIIWFVRRGQL